MKRTTIHISAAIALLLGLAACTQDEAGFLPEGAEGTPIVFTATGLNPAATATAGTRAPVDGNWTGVQSVAVLMDGTVKAYDVTPSTAAPTSATLTSTDPYYWTNHKNATDWQAGGEYTYTVSLAAAKDLGYTIESNGSYTVTSADGLMNIAKLVNGGKTDINITLTADIDLTGKNWTPIGTSFSNKYTGTFDGGGHTIKGLTVTTNDQFVGLFGSIGNAGTVKNVMMEDVQITSNRSSGFAGGVAGYSDGTIENCSVSGSVSGTVYVGGVVGAQWEGSITGCSSSATVKGMVHVGGVAGQTNGGATLTACYATGNVTLEIDPRKNIAGGSLVGFNGGNGVRACYATGNVTSTGSSTGNVHIGGFLGDNYTYLTACYWKNNHEQGIGYNNKSTKATKVDGTVVTWQKAVDAMNTALQNAGSEWRYELKPKYNPNKKGGRDGTHGESTNESGCVCKFLSGTN